MCENHPKESMFGLYHRQTGAIQKEGFSWTTSCFCLNVLCDDVCAGSPLRGGSALLDAKTQDLLPRINWES